ncbi:hypothetical protein [Streptomyces sp. NPDC058252]|uniref:hypothetical protein n=1 Tax=Streptomyces sp. NPDC058252 TaxID=3346405 RepID=UPI0036EA67DB
MTDHRTPYDEALDVMLTAGIDRGRADELLMAVWEQGRAQKPQSGECEKCTGTALHNLLGHDALGHKTANSLTARSVYTPEALKSRGLEWVLDFTSVGTKGVDRIEERLSKDDYQRFADTRWSA